MSDRLAISASFSVLMMAVYVLFGANVQRVELSPGAQASLPSLEASAGLRSPSLGLPFAD